MLNRKETQLSTLYQTSPEDSSKLECFNSPRCQRTGCALTDVRSGETKRSKFTSNSKLVRSSLFKSIKGRPNKRQEQLQQKNLEKEILTDALNNMEREKMGAIINFANSFEDLARYGACLARLLSFYDSK